MTDETAVLIIIITCVLSIAIIFGIALWEEQYKKLTKEIQISLGLERWLYTGGADAHIRLKSAKAVLAYTPLQFFKEDRSRLEEVSLVLDNKLEYADMLRDFLEENAFKQRARYSRVVRDIQKNFNYLYSYDVIVQYRSPAGRSFQQKVLYIDRETVDGFLADPSVLMSKSEYNQMVKEQNKLLLDEKHHEYYEQVNVIIDLANGTREKLICEGDRDELDRLIASLFDRTVNSIKKIKDIHSEEWGVIGGFISNIEQKVNAIVDKNQLLLDYYDSDEFAQIKSTCDALMDSQRDFNSYINEKVQSISTLFGTRVVRNETVIEDEYNYIRPYKKSITPFTAEVSAQVFASAENNPIEYIIKYFYPTKAQYPEQIQKLQLLIEELETLKDAKQIIENYKKDYQQYLINVPSFVMENDEDGFYSRLGFANISENALTVEYKFSYTSGGGMAQRNFTVPMTEETIIELVNILQSKLSMTAFAKEQRAMMTSKLRQQIKERDDYTCKCCGNSTYAEPNLLLEIDHIIPVSKGGATVENNLQTLCWKCNRSKGAKM